MHFFSFKYQFHQKKITDFRIVVRAEKKLERSLKFVNMKVHSFFYLICFSRILASPTTTGKGGRSCFQLRIATSYD